jgi:DNA invertase Pin-like site-specific DNA recombinase
MLAAHEDLGMARKAYSYIRFSGRRQEAGDSHRRQWSLAEQAAKEERINLDRTITLADKGISGFRGANWEKGDLGKFLDLVDAGVIAKGSVLIIERVNRLSRLPWMDQVALWQELLRRDITIRTCMPPSRYTKANMNELAVGCPVVLFMMLGHQESVQKSEWSREAWGEKKRKARLDRLPHGQACPLWIRPVTVPHPKDPARAITIGYEPIRERAEVLRWMFTESLGGKGAFTIRKELDGQVKPWGHARRWALSTVKKFLRGREAIGSYRPGGCDESGRRIVGGEWIEGYYPIVVDPKVFDAVQASMRSRRKKGGRAGQSEANLFTHLVRERGTGEPMALRPRVTAGRTYRYLMAQAEHSSAPYREFERGVLRAIAQLTARDVDGRHEADELTARVESLQQERAQTAVKLEVLDAQIHELPPIKWPPRVVARMAELGEKIEQQDKELRTAKEAANTSGRTEALTDLKTSIELLDENRDTPEEVTIRRRIKSRLRLIVESIWVDVQAMHKRSRYVHVQLFLHGGEKRYFCLPCGCKSDVPALDLEAVDFRKSGRAKKAGMHA